MSDTETTKTEIEKKRIPNFNLRDSLERGGVELPLVHDTVKRGPYAGYVYPRFNATPENFSDVVNGMGIEEACDIFNRLFQREGINGLIQYSDAKTEPHPEDSKKKLGTITTVTEDKLYQALSTGTCRGETKKELVERLDEKNSQLVELGDILAEIDADQDPIGYQEAVQKMTHIVRDIKLIQENIAARSRKSAEDDE